MIDGSKATNVGMHSFTAQNVSLSQIVATEWLKEAIVSSYETLVDVLVWSQEPLRDLKRLICELQEKKYSADWWFLESKFRISCLKFDRDPKTIDDLTTYPWQTPAGL